jgi:hypothetical protein
MIGTMKNGKGTNMSKPLTALLLLTALSAASDITVIVEGQENITLRIEDDIWHICPGTAVGCADMNNRVAYVARGWATETLIIHEIMHIALNESQHTDAFYQKVNEFSGR